MAKKNLSLADLSRLRKDSRQSPTKITEDKSNKVEKSDSNAIASSEESKKVGRPKSIRSNPEYESTTIRLHKKTKAKARYILATQPDKMDLQTLLNDLLEKFVSEHDS